MRSSRPVVWKQLGVAAAAALILAGCAGPPPKVPEPAPPRGDAKAEAAGDEAASPLLPRLHRAALDFQSAREKGDALGMARAAVARRGLDDVRVRLGDAERAPRVLTTSSMLAEARALAGGDAALLAEIDRIASSGSSSWMSALTCSAKAGSDEPACAGALGGVLFGVGHGAVPELIANEERRLEAVPVSLAPGQARTWRVRNHARHSLWVWATKASGAVLSLRSVKGGGVIDSADDAAGELLCHWRPVTDEEAFVEIRNASQREIQLFLAAERTFVPE